MDLTRFCTSLARCSASSPLPVLRCAARAGSVGAPAPASAERAISGPGLAAIDATLREIDGAPLSHLAPEEVSARARGHLDPHAVEAVRLFSGWLGAVAGDLALTLGARGGVFLAGGALAGLGQAFDRALFVERFRAKGRFREYLAPIPVHRITRVDASLLGLSRALQA